MSNKVVLSLEVAGNLEDVEPQFQDQIPITYILQKVSDIWSDNKLPNVLIVKAKTGSGKSVLMPKDLFLHFKCKVLVAEPTIVNATKIPVDIASLYGLRLGHDLGYQTGSLKLIPSQPIHLIYKTSQLVTNSIYKNDDLQNTIVVIDEAHLSSLQTIEALAALRDLSMRSNSRQDPFVIVTSATISTDLYASYFNTDQVVKVKGSTSEKHYFFPPQELNNVSAYLKKTLSQIFSKAKQDDDVLIFCPAFSIMLRLQSRLQEIDPKALILTFQSSDVQLGTDNYRLMMKPASVIGCSHKVILATDVAETGITLPSLKYVLDLGYQKFITVDPTRGVNIAVDVFPASKDSSEQRAGRVGRNTVGYVYPFLPQDLYQDMLRDYKPSGIFTDYYYSLLLWIMDKERESRTEFKTLQPRSKDIEHYMKTALLMNGFIDSADNGQFTTTALANMFKKTTYITPFDFKFMCLCMSEGIQCIEALDIINTINLRISYTPNPLIMDQLIESYLGLIKFISNPRLHPQDEQAFMSILDNRYKIVDTLMSLSIDPFAGECLLEIDPEKEKDKFIAHIRKIKRCLYYSYLHKVARYEPKKKAYITHLGYEFKETEVLNAFKIELAPSYVIVQKSLIQVDSSLTKKERQKGISVLDGFVAIDDNLLNEFRDDTIKCSFSYDIATLSPNEAQQRMRQYELLCNENQHPLLQQLASPLA